MKVILIHGIHSQEGHNNMSALLPYITRDLPGVDVDIYQYGFMGFWQARWRNDGVAERLADKLAGEDCVLITHSNGAAITYLATRKYGLKLNGVVNINPALDRWKTAIANWSLTIHSDNDRWVNLSQWIPFHVWGDQGRVGYCGDRSTVVNLNASLEPAGIRYDDHCGMFEASRISEWSHIITDYIAEMELI